MVGLEQQTLRRQLILAPDCARVGLMAARQTLDRQTRAKFKISWGTRGMGGKSKRRTPRGSQENCTYVNAGTKRNALPFVGDARARASVPGRASKPHLSTQNVDPELVASGEVCGEMFEAAAG